MEAECVACSVAMQEVMWLRSFVQVLNLTHKVDDPIEMLYDYIAAIQFAKDLKFYWNQKTKHIKRLYYFV